MKYTEFFSKFYKGRNAGGILGHKSKEKIPEYFMRVALPEDYHYLLPTSSSTYGKWFEGTRKPESNIWSIVVSQFDEDSFIESTTKDLNDSVLKDVMRQFGIDLQVGEDPDKRLFAFAMAKLFYAIAQGNGETTYEANKYYKPETHILSFPEYVSRTITKYEKIRTPFSEGEERLIEDIYVCNKLSSRLSDTKFRHRGTPEKTIFNATLDLIEEYSKKVILVANGGMGKTILLQHLFLESIRKHEKTGLLPIVIELRDFSDGNDLLNDYIIKTAGVYDDSLTSKKVENLMVSGKFQILMDGADEIDPSDEKAFQRKLSELVSRYPYNQYIVASRECGLLKGITGFSRMYLHPFDKEQSSTLIDNLLKGYDSETTISDIKKYIESDFLQKHKVFASNPMLLTFVIMKYPINDSFDEKKRLFYRAVYDAIVYGHDEEKEGYSRVFRSAQNADEFTKVFSELCAVTYIKHETEFDLDTFDELFNNLVTKNTVENPKAMTSKCFIHDACATACMMYEQDTKLLYIDSGFQEYLFAKYYFSADPEKLIALGRALWDISETEFDGVDAFEMLNEFSSEKIEKCLFKPYLHNIFEHKDESAQFIRFLRHGYREFEYQVTDIDTIAVYTSENNAEWIAQKPIIIEPSSVIFALLLQRLEIPKLLCLDVFENALSYSDFMIAGIFGEGYLEPTDGTRKIIPRRLLRQEMDDIQVYERTHSVENYIRDDNGSLVCFGNEFRVNFDEVLEHPDKYPDLINILKTKEDDVWKMYCKLKIYYEELGNRYRD